MGIGKKFNEEFVALGVVIDLRNATEGIVKLRNKPGRVEGIGSQVEDAIKKGSLGFKEALSIRGKLSFAEGQNYGRIAAPAAQMLSRWRPHMD